MSDQVVIETARLRIRKAVTSGDDVDFYCSLWTNPQVMVNVGFPDGLRITREEIRDGITRKAGSVFSAQLIVIDKESGLPIGECKLGSPDADGISETDVKLLPKFWGRGFGTEIKRALVDYLFTHTDCTAIKATPNKNNIASQKMQEAVGGKRVGEGVFRFPDHMRDYTCDVPHYVYMVYRKDWERPYESNRVR